MNSDTHARGDAGTPGEHGHLCVMIANPGMHDNMPANDGRALTTHLAVRDRSRTILIRNRFRRFFFRGPPGMVGTEEGW